MRNIKDTQFKKLATELWQVQITQYREVPVVAPVCKNAHHEVTPE